MALDRARDLAVVFTRSRAADFYERLHGPIVAGLPAAADVQIATGREPLWVNLGYWRGVPSIDENNCGAAGDLLTQAQEQLADLLATAAGIGPGDTVLDCGFGYGDQDIRWAERIGPAKIIGLNVTEGQVRIAQERCRLLGLTDVLDLRLGSATAMPLAAASVDAVTALECAFHFRTRRDFLTEAFRVLRPGGRVAVADIFQKTDREKGVPLRSRLRHRASRRIYAIPEANVWTTRRYVETLGEVGFADIGVESIAADVFPRFATALAALDAARHTDSADAVRAAVRATSARDVEQLVWQRELNFDEYAIVSARKPA